MTFDERVKQHLTRYKREVLDVQTDGPCQYQSVISLPTPEVGFTIAVT